MPPLLQRRPETLRLTASGAFLLGLLGFCELLRPVESSVRAGAVDLLRRALRCRPERSVVAALVAIAVGRDGPGITPPACLLPVTARQTGGPWTQPLGDPPSGDREQGSPVWRAVSRIASARVSISSRRSVSASRMSA